MKIGVLGCAGRMGQAIMTEILASDDHALAGGTEAVGSPHLGKDLGDLLGNEPIGKMVADDASALIAASDVVIEFSTPAATVTHAELAAEHGTAHVIGTTGIGEDHRLVIERAAGQTAIVWAANMSLGVNLLLGLAKKVAAVLPAEAFDIEIVEMHHRQKVDAPSGTALALGEAVAKGRKVELDRMADRGRDGLTGAREAGRIGFAALRGGDVIGDHSVIFAGSGERLELTHKASDRTIYAKGAVRAAAWAKMQGPGLYTMLDVLDLN